MERLATLWIITHLIRNGTIKLIGITNPTTHRKILQKKRNIWGWVGGKQWLSLIKSFFQCLDSSFGNYSHIPSFPRQYRQIIWLPPNWRGWGLGVVNISNSTMLSHKWTGLFETLWAIPQQSCSSHPLSPHTPPSLQHHSLQVRICWHLTLLQFSLSCSHIHSLEPYHDLWK